jgi:hypothetical protein
VSVWLEPLRVAVTVAVTLEAGTVVVMAKLAVVAPARTVTVAGTTTWTSVELRETTSPEGPAALAIVTVPVAPWPPPTKLGLTTKLETAGRLMPRVSLCEEALKVPV